MMRMRMKLIIDGLEDLWRERLWREEHPPKAKRDRSL